MRPSLTRRLLTLYVATILVVVGVTGGLVWVMMRRALHAGLDETLRTEAQTLAGRLEVENGRVEFDAGASLAEYQQRTDALVQVMDEGGGIVFSSFALADNRTLIDHASASGGAGELSWFTALLVADEKAFRIVALHMRAGPDDESPVPDGNDGALGAWVFVARSLAPMDRTLGQLASVLALAAGASVLLALVGGFVAARRGTQPVRTLAESVGRVNPGDAELILDHDRIPVELEPIVRTTGRLLERVREELARQRQLTADVAHDLRTPVAGVRTLLDVCLQRERGSDEYVSAMEKSRAALRQLSQLLDDVLTLSRLDAGADQPLAAPVALAGILDAAVATVQPLAAARQVSIQITACPPAEIRTDRAKLTKILSNLLNNAVQHSPPGETVRIDTRIDDGLLEVSVADRGPGIPPDLRDRIFDRFVRGDAARAGGDGRHGLGLSIAAGLARLLGGDVVLDEGHAPGSRFVVRMAHVEVCE